MKALSNKERHELEQARLKICALLSKKLRNKTPAQVFQEIDTDNNGQISLFNLSSYLSFAGWKIDKDQISKVLKVIDFNKDGSISLQEFKQFLFTEDESSAGKSSSIDRRQMEHFVANINQRILNYLKQQNFSFNDLFKLIDNDRSGYVSTVELMVFLLEKLSMKLKFEEIQIIVSHYDTNNDDSIDLHELIEGLRSQAQQTGSKYDSLFSKDKSQLSTIEYICDQLHNHMQVHKKTRGDLFDIFDGDSDKFISKQETRQAFLKMQIPLTQTQLSEFYSFIDKNGDERVSIQEFISVLKSELTRLEKAGKLGQSLRGTATPTPQTGGLNAPPQMYDSGRRATRTSMMQQSGGEIDYSSAAPAPGSADESLMKRIAANIRAKKQQYVSQFEKKSKGSSYVSHDDFKLILETLTEEFTENEIDKIRSQICESNNRGVIYSSFLKLENFNASAMRPSIAVGMGGGISSSSHVGKTKEDMTKQIFARIARVLKQKKINYEHAFQRFDKDGDRSISQGEFRQVFQELDMNLTSQDIADMYNYVDRNKDGVVKIDEFVAVLV